MTMKRVLIILFMILLVIPLSLAQTNDEYTTIGGIDGDYSSGFGTGIFKQSGLAVSSGTPPPLIGDLDGDGSNEIVIVEETGIIKILNQTLGLIGLETVQVGARKSNIILFDIDGDSRKEIIFAGDIEEIITIFDFDGSDLTLQASINYSNPLYHLKALNENPPSGQTVLNCAGVNSCQLHVTSFSDILVTGLNANITVVRFNSTSLIDFNTVLTKSNQRPFCAPNIRNLDVVDLNADGNKEYVSVWGDRDAADQKLIIIAVNITGELLTGFPVTDTALSNGNNDDCFDTLSAIGQTFSPATSFPFEGGDEGSSQSQILIAFQTAPSDFLIKEFSSAGVEIDRFPQLVTGDSRLISNVARGNFLPDTGNVDICALGYDETDTELELICASRLSTDFGFFATFSKTNTYRINVSGKFQVTDDPDRYDAMLHSVNQEGSETSCLDIECEPNDLDEVLTSFGIFKLQRTGALCDSFFGFCELKEIFPQPSTINRSGAFIPVDVQNSGAEDLFLTTDTNLFFFDALAEDLGAQIVRSSIFINPCLDSGALAVNTSISLSFSVIDTDTVAEADKDQVFAQVVAYAGSSNEHEALVQGALDSGTTFFFDSSDGLFINKTIGTGITFIRLIANDTGSTKQDIVDIPFSVAETGVESDDCTQLGFEVVVEDVFISDPDLLQDATDDAITTGILGIGEQTGLAGTTVWLIIMIAFAIGIFFRSASIGWSGNSALGAIAVVETLFIIVGARLGILSTALVVIIVILGVVILGVFLGRFLTGSGSGMNNG